MNTLIVIILLYAVLRFSAKYFLPILLKIFLNKAKKRFEEQRNPGAKARQTANNEKIKYPSRARSHSDSELEYTEFEEVVETNQNSIHNT